MEPEGPFYTTRCKQKRERRAKGGLHIFTMASQPRVIERKGFSISLSQKWKISRDESSLSVLYFLLVMEDFHFYFHVREILSALFDQL